MHDAIEEQSHRFAHGVTESLQFAVREAIELLVNEWAVDRTAAAEAATDPNPSRGAALWQAMRITLTSRSATTAALRSRPSTSRPRPSPLSTGCSFAFYAEARGGELEILPIDEDTYRLGYSLESLRDLEQVPLTAATEDGAYFHEHLKKLFQLIHDGFHPEAGQSGDQQLLLDAVSGQVRAFTMRPLTATLFARRARRS